MNIFVVDSDPVIAAQSLCDKHVVKMPLETAQMLCTAYPNGFAPYAHTHVNHPCTIWAKQSVANYRWLIAHGLALCEEYTFRYGRKHACQSVIEWCSRGIEYIDLPDGPLTSHAQALPEDLRCADPVVAYRSYYRIAKANIARWNKGRPAPVWWDL